MEKVFSYVRIALITAVLFVNITGFSSAAFLNWVTADGFTKEVKVDDGPIYWDEWQNGFLEFVSCGRYNS